MPAGRPRSFDVEKALDRAMRVFWKKGFEGATLPDLTRAMGINRPSLYAAFGNKEELFRKALDRYAEGPACRVRAALEEPTARKAAEALLYSGIDVVTDPKSPRGCLMVQSALACGDEAEPVKREMAKRRASTELQLRERFERAQEEGDLCRECCAEDLARYVTTLAYGMAVLAAGGAKREELRRVVDVALKCWPE